MKKIPIEAVADHEQRNAARKQLIRVIQEVAALSPMMLINTYPHDMRGIPAKNQHLFSDTLMELSALFRDKSPIRLQRMAGVEQVAQILELVKALGLKMGVDEGVPYWDVPVQAALDYLNQ